MLLTVSGQFTWDANARSYYEDWYNSRTVTKDPMLAGFDRTLYIQIIKVAMLLRLSQGIDLNMTLECIQTAMAIMDKVMITLPAVFSGMGRNELNAVRAKIANLLGSTGPLPEKRLKGMMYSEASGRDLDDILSVMESSEQIVRIQQKKGDLVKVWIALKKDSSEESIKLAIARLEAPVAPRPTT
jgi:hypothetical protein